MAFYPDITEDNILSLKLVVQMVTKDPEYLDRKDCPYSDMMKDFLRGILTVVDAEIPDLFEGGLSDEPEVLDRQIQKILNRMEAMEHELRSFEPNERMAFFKTQTSLLEKLVTLREKVTNQREMMSFQAVVISTLEEVCDADQIKTFMERLSK